MRWEYEFGLWTNRHSNLHEFEINLIIDMDGRYDKFEINLIIDGQKDGMINLKNKFKRQLVVII